MGVKGGGRDKNLWTVAACGAKLLFHILFYFLLFILGRHYYLRTRIPLMCMYACMLLGMSSCLCLFLLLISWLWDAEIWMATKVDGWNTYQGINLLQVMNGGWRRRLGQCTYLPHAKSKKASCTWV
ncbi:hypothetical protein B0H66DRAFT_335950 [Apodospora peruviana]|uniref:Uncharacterized protein n=1 Tax=Apodospora peruviana TaxID=516989 RepID=A0AAE0HYB4_9PEZI|nr:hypothetical protein B0H66DRAFT_335950 [Apodospora peruviana]